MKVSNKGKEDAGNEVGGSSNVNDSVRVSEGRDTKTGYVSVSEGNIWK